MSIEEMRCNGEAKQEIMSLSEGLLTYRRRKRMRTQTGGDSSSRQEDAGVPADEKVFNLDPNQAKSTDFGWEHGKKVNGNRYHWKCKWCNFVGRSGGVTRLKKHLAGGWHVKPCPKVPEHISNTMNTHLIQLSRKRLFKGRQWEREQNDIYETNSEGPYVGKSVYKPHRQVGLNMPLTNGTEQSGKAAKSFETDSHHSRDSYPGSNFATQELNTNMVQVNDAFQISKKTARRYRTVGRRSRDSYRRSRSCLRRYKTDMTKAMSDTHDAMLYNDVHEQETLGSTDNHWRSILQHMLQMPDVPGAGGIERSITDALIHGAAGGNRTSKLADTLMDTAKPKDRHKDHLEVAGNSQKVNIFVNTPVDVSESGTCDQTAAIANKHKCQDCFINILCSEKFVCLCNLLCENFQGIKFEKLFDMGKINSNMKNGVYGQSPGLFNQDLQQMWKKFQKVGEEMVLLATSLSNMSQVVEDELVQEASPQKCEENIGKNSNDSETETQQLPSCESVPSTKPDQTEASCLHKACTCKQCGSEVDGERSLMCDECEAAYHFSCVNPAVQEIPMRSWYCNSCTNKKMLEPLELSNTQQEQEQDSMHDDCIVCERLEISEEAKGNLDQLGIASGSRESSISIMESDDEQAEPSRTALSGLCKQCGTCEDEDKRFLICGHSQCPYKYYHIRCLKTSQIASFQQQNKDCWYCPSCLCRACFLDRDDDMIVLCDGCDEAYHTYCMKPPRNCVPKGQWYCVHCNVAKAKEGMRRYEEWILQQHGRKCDWRPQSNNNDAITGTRPMDVLLSAVEKLSSEDNLAAAARKIK